MAGGGHAGRGIAAGGLAALCWAAYTLLSKRILVDGAPIAVTALSTALGTLPILPFALWASGGDVGGWHASAIGRLRGDVLVWLLYLVLLSTVLAFLLYLWALSRLSAGSATSFIYLMPAFGLVWGWWILRETVTAAQLAGAAALLAGVALASGERRT